MKDVIYYNSQDRHYKYPFGAVPCHSEISFRIGINRTLLVKYVQLRIWYENQEQKLEMVLDKEYGDTKEYLLSIRAPKKPSLLWYYFIIGTEDHIYYYGNNEAQLGGVGCLSNEIPHSYQITIYKEEAKTPEWFKGQVMYQIFVDRFFNGNDNGKVLNPKPKALIHANWYDTPVYIRDEQGDILRWDFFGGNLLGVIKKLPYLKELGIGVIYLNPIFEAESNHKYDTGHYKKVDAMFGDYETLKNLCQEADKMGISIILDGVFSHTGTNSLYFNKFGDYPELGAYQSLDSKYYPWYRFIEYPNQYECWWGIKNLPNVNETEESYMNYMIRDSDSVLKHWMKVGIKGWRLDVVDELPEAFVKLFYKTLKGIDTDYILIGEVWEDASKKESYGEQREYFLGEELDSVMNYPLRNAIVDYVLGKTTAEHTLALIMSLKENYPAHNFYATMNHISNHDLPRILTVIEESYGMEKLDISYKLLQLITLLQMTFPGVPSVYYGDEVGVDGGKDPYNRKTYPWGKENKRIFQWYQCLIHLRNAHDVLKTGEFIPLLAKGDVFCYMRVIEGGKDKFGVPKDNGRFIIIMNRSLKQQHEIELNINNSFWKDVWNNEKVSIRGGKLNIVLEPLAFKVFIEEYV